MPDTGQAQEQEEHNPTEATLPYHQGSPPEQLEEPQPEVQADDTGAQAAEEQVEPYVQHKLLEMVHGLNASMEALLQPSRHIELEVKALQDEADAAEAQALQVKQQVEERLMNLAHTVDNFHQKIKQVLPVTSHKRSREEMEQSAEGQQEGTP